jgi:electron transfer flavoprotein alpha subunit
MKTLIITTLHHGKLNPNLLHLFSCAEKINNSCDVIAIGNNTTNPAQEIATYPIVNNVLTIQGCSLENILAENVADQLAQIIGNYTHALIAADSFGKNLLPRIAGILAIGQISEVVDIVSPNIFKRFMYAGNVLTEVESLEDIKLLTVRTTNFAAYEKIREANNTQANIQAVKFDNIIHPGVKVVNEHIIDKSVDLAFAKVVVSGGRSLGSVEAFDANIRVLADKLNAAVGATRAAVDSGYAPNDCQVGQTGKMIAPQVYLAVGISGAVQHIAGMKDSQTVIAINTDHTAPIFEHANYGLIADLFDVVPELISKCK